MNHDDLKKQRWPMTFASWALALREERLDVCWIHYVAADVLTALHASNGIICELVSHPNSDQPKAYVRDYLQEAPMSGMERRRVQP